jgi:hypothetical protein
MPAMTWRQLADFLNTLAIRGDKRLDDRVIVYDSTNGEYNPADVVEFNDKNDPIMSPNQLFIFSHEWGDHNTS